MNSQIPSLDSETSQATVSPREQINKTKQRNLYFGIAAFCSLFQIFSNVFDFVNLFTEKINGSKTDLIIFLVYIFFDFFTAFLAFLVTFILRLYSLYSKPVCLIRVLYTNIFFSFISTILFLYCAISLFDNELHFIRLITQIGMIASQVPFSWIWGGPLLYVVKDAPLLEEAQQPMLQRNRE